MGKLQINGGLKVQGRVIGSGDDEGIVIDYASNNYATLTLGSPSAKRSVFYLSSTGSPFWRYNNGTDSFNIEHPGKTGTIALTSDIPTSMAWSSITGKPSTFTPSSHTHNYLSYPAQLTSDSAIDNFNTANTFQISTWNNTSTPGVTNGIIINAGWTSTSYGAQIAIDDDPTYYIALRQRGTSGWSGWKRIPMGDGTGASGTWGINITGSSGSAIKATYLEGPDDSMKLYAEYSNEINFGGTNAATTIYFGYRAKDSKPIPTQFVFGGSGGSATIMANYFTGTAALSNRLAIKGVASGDSHALALKNYFESNKSSIPRNELTTYYSTAYGNGSLYMGYFLSGYDSTPYGGFFVAHYDTPYYVGISYNNYNQQTILTSSNYSSWCAPASHTHSYLPLSGGTMSGTIVTPGNDSSVIRPAKNNYDQVGSSSYKFWKMFATYGYFDYVVTTNYGSSDPTSTSLPVGSIYYKTS